ncbi:hypothetical protein CEUSTIGMA_g10274.t1 [Chlamydomonas eustigma]|uniref:Protein kinase domain-containing protein n=1 Tax=Chlamydomonas eustigma TaxID=1157962 RepID=A0A250XIE1_9CHLO|nr:hypothetical protein CEUSTIGMA_g10274.t1 [Chlamydomonas eustigma]|eukprot:GAX82848.1 hypothetical protein CEUSTIGMA_g10274.t1 [Chlamydomonas eustigma]
MTTQKEEDALRLRLLLHQHYEFVHDHSVKDKKRLVKECFTGCGRNDNLGDVGLYCEAVFASKTYHANLNVLCDVEVVGAGQLRLFYESCAFSLRQIQKKWISTGFPLPEVKSLVYQAVSAVSHLHAHHICHSSLCPQSFFLQENGMLKLIGLNTACITAQAHPRADTASDLPLSTCASPEIILHDNVDSGMPSDIWALGCICAELAIGRPLFYGQSESELLWSISKLMGMCPRHISIAQGRADCQRILKRIVECSFENFMARFSQFEPSLMKFLDRCLQPDPRKRATVAELLSSDFLRDVPASLRDLLIAEQHRVQSLQDTHERLLLQAKVSNLAAQMALTGVDVTAAAMAAGLVSARQSGAGGMEETGQQVVLLSRLSSGLGYASGCSKVVKPPPSVTGGTVPISGARLLRCSVDGGSTSISTPSLTAAPTLHMQLRGRSRHSVSGSVCSVSRVGPDSVSHAGKLARHSDSGRLQTQDSSSDLHGLLLRTSGGKSNRLSVDGRLGSDTGEGREEVQSKLCTQNNIIGGLLSDNGDIALSSDAQEPGSALASGVVSKNVKRLLVGPRAPYVHGCPAVTVDDEAAGTSGVVRPRAAGMAAGPRLHLLGSCQVPSCPSPNTKVSTWLQVVPEEALGLQCQGGPPEEAGLQHQGGSSKALQLCEQVEEHKLCEQVEEHKLCEQVHQSHCSSRSNGIVYFDTAFLESSSPNIDKHASSSASSHYSSATSSSTSSHYPSATSSSTSSLCPSATGVYISSSHSVGHSMIKRHDAAVMKMEEERPVLIKMSMPQLRITSASLPLQPSNQLTSHNLSVPHQPQNCVRPSWSVSQMQIPQPLSQIAQHVQHILQPACPTTQGLHRPPSASQTAQGLQRPPSASQSLPSSRQFQNSASFQLKHLVPKSQDQSACLTFKECPQDAEEVVMGPMASFAADILREVKKKRAVASSGSDTRMPADQQDKEECSHNAHMADNVVDNVEPQTLTNRVQEGLKLNSLEVQVDSDMRDKRQVYRPLSAMTATSDESTARHMLPSSSASRDVKRDKIRPLTSSSARGIQSNKAISGHAARDRASCCNTAVVHPLIMSARKSGTAYQEEKELAALVQRHQH